MDSVNLTDDAKRMLGDPKKAIIAMALPMMFATVIQSMNSVIDAAWVSGLGTGALAATGVVFPYFFLASGLGNCIGSGASQALSRRLGAKDYKGTNKVATQSIVVSMIVSLALSAILLVFARPLLDLTGAGEYMDECMQYAIPLFSGVAAVVLSDIMSSLLRSEGAAKRAMSVHLTAAIINIILDPIFIYGLDLGLTGAALATVISLLLSAAPPLYWYLIKKDTTVRITLKEYHFDREIERDIMRISIPASAEVILMTFIYTIMNWIIIMVDPDDGVAVYTTGWRPIVVMMIPAMSICFSITPICAAAYGSGEKDKLVEAFSYALKIGTLIMVIICALTLVAAPYIASIFCQSESTAHLAENITSFLRICALFLPFISITYCSMGLFQSLGMGMRSLASTLLMNLLRIPVCAGLAGFGILSYLWFGVSVSIVAGAFISGLLALYSIHSVTRKIPNASEN